MFGIRSKARSATLRSTKATSYIAGLDTIGVLIRLLQHDMVWSPFDSGLRLDQHVSIGSRKVRPVAAVVIEQDIVAECTLLVLEKRLVTACEPHDSESTVSNPVE